MVFSQKFDPTESASCSICLEEIKPQQLIADHGKELHPHHQTCLQLWLRARRARNEPTTCPTCLEKLEISTLPKESWNFLINSADVVDGLHRALAIGAPRVGLGTTFTLLFGLRTSNVTCNVLLSRIAVVCGLYQIFALLAMRAEQENDEWRQNGIKFSQKEVIKGLMQHVFLLLAGSTLSDRMLGQKYGGARVLLFTAMSVSYEIYRSIYHGIQERRGDAIRQAFENR